MTTYTPNALNQITSVSGPGISLSLGYDLDGNRSTRTGSGGGGEASYGYDFENRLVSLSQGGVGYAYAYDYRGRRVTRTEAGAQTAVIFSGGVSALEQEGGATTVEFLRGSDLGGGGVGGLLYSLRGCFPRYSHENGRGDVVAQSDSTGNLLFQASYEAYGRRTLAAGTTPDRQRANTKEEDPTGLLNEGFRYRDLELGVFLTRDPAGFVDGPNLYAYVQQDPWTKFDPEGLFWSAIVTAGFEAYDTYQYARGNISGADYAGRMALNGAAFMADAATGGMGGGLAVRIAANSSRIVKTGVAVAKTLDRSNTAYETATGAVEFGQTVVDAAETGDGRGVFRAAAAQAGEQMVQSALGVRRQTNKQLRDLGEGPEVDAMRVSGDGADVSMSDYPYTRSTNDSTRDAVRARATGEDGVTRSEHTGNAVGQQMHTDHHPQTSRKMRENAARTGMSKEEWDQTQNDPSNFKASTAKENVGHAFEEQ